MSRTKRPPYERIRTGPRAFAPRGPFPRTSLFVAPDEDQYQDQRQDQNQDQVAGEVEVMYVDRETETGGIEAGGIEADGSSGPVRNSRSPLPMEATPIVRRPTPEPINDFVPLGAAGDIQEPAAAQSVPASERAIGEAESYSMQKGHGNIVEAIEEIAPLTEEQKIVRLATQVQQSNEEQDNNEKPAVSASGATMPTPGESITSPVVPSNDSRSPTVRGNSPVVQGPTPEPIDDFVPLGIAKQPSVPAIQPSVPAIQSSVPAIQPQPNAVATAAPRARQPRRSALQMLAGNVAQNATASDDPGVFARTRSKTQPVTPAPAPAPAPAAATKPRKQRRATNKPTGVEKPKSRGKTVSADPSRLVLRVPRAALELLDDPVPRFQPFGRAHGLALAPPQPQPQLQPQLGPVPVPVPQPRARVPAPPVSRHPLSALQRETLQAQLDVLDRSIIRAAAQSALRAREKEEIDRQIEQWMRDKEEIDRQLE